MRAVASIVQVAIGTSSDVVVTAAIIVRSASATFWRSRPPLY
jgi:hypothetical protein